MGNGCSSDRQNGQVAACTLENNELLHSVEDAIIEDFQNRFSEAERIAESLITEEHQELANVLGSLTDLVQRNTLIHWRNDQNSKNISQGGQMENNGEIIDLNCPLSKNQGLHTPRNAQSFSKHGLQENNNNHGVFLDELQSYSEDAASMMTTNTRTKEIKGTQPLEKILDGSDTKLQGISKRRPPKMLNLEQSFQTFFEDSGESFQRRYKEIRVFSRKPDEEEGIIQQDFRKREKQQQKGQNREEVIQQELSPYQGSQESEGNYEGSDEENFKAKEKLITNLFSPKAIDGGIHFSEDLIHNNNGYQHRVLRKASSTQLVIKSPRGIRDQDKSPKKHRTELPSFAVPGGIFQGQIQDTKRNGIGQQTFLDGTVFMGEWVKDKRSGKGIQIWPDDTLYEGQWQNDVIEGIGRIEYSNGSFYIGEWKNNKFHGKGRFSHFSGSFYEGSWVQDTQHGKGIEVQLYPHYSRYEGQFVNGKKSGKGRLLMENGFEYRGDFFNNSVHGMGVYRWQSGVVYEGHWENSKMSGSGKMIWPSGIVYQGEFSNDQKCGVGVLEYGDGSKYVGEWNHDKQDGKGTFYFKKSQAQLKGIWVYGKLITALALVLPRANSNYITNIPINMIKSVNALRNQADVQQTDLGRVFLAIPDSQRQSVNMMSSRSAKQQNKLNEEQNNKGQQKKNKKEGIGKNYLSNNDDKHNNTSNNNNTQTGLEVNNNNNKSDQQEEPTFKKKLSQFKYALSLQTD